MVVRFLCSHMVVCVVCVLISSADKDTSHTGLGSIHVTSFYFNYLFKSPTSKHSHILRYYWSGTQHMNFEGAQSSPSHSSLLPPQIHVLLVCKIHSPIPKAPEGLIHSTPSPKISSMSGMNKTWGMIHPESKFPSSLDLWNQISYLLPKYSGGTGIR